MICTDNYVEKANAGHGGVGYEKMIVTADLLKEIDSNKVIPIIRQQGSHNVPRFLRTKMFLDFSTDEQFEFSFDELVRDLHGSPLFEKPPVENSPFTPVRESEPERTGDSLRELMTIAVRHFEAGENYFDYQQVLREWPASRLMLDSVIDVAKFEGLIQQDGDLDLRLTEKGKHYAIQHDLHK